MTDQLNLFTDHHAAAAAPHRHRSTPTDLPLSPPPWRDDLDRHVPVVWFELGPAGRAVL